MQFLHVNFVRGDKGRCLMLRSLVKKATAHHNQQQMAHQQQQLLLHHANASNNNLMNQLRMGMMPPGMGIGHFGMGFGAPFGMAEAGMMFQQHLMLTQQGQIQQYQNAQMQFQHLMNQGQGPISSAMLGMSRNHRGRNAPRAAATAATTKSGTTTTATAMPTSEYSLDRLQRYNNK